MAKILVADDDPSMRELVEIMVEGEGHQVVAVEDGRQCIERLDRESFDLLITDLFMPNLDGFELMADLQGRNSRMPVICMTGGLQGTVYPYAQAMLLAGARAVLTKPFSKEELTTELRAALAP